MKVSETKINDKGFFITLQFDREEIKDLIGIDPLYYLEEKHDKILNDLMNRFHSDVEKKKRAEHHSG